MNIITAKHRVRLILSAAALGSAILFAGCNTTQSGEGGSSYAAGKEEVVLEKGMAKDEVVALLGEPKTVNEIYQDSVAAEVWTYEREKVESSTIESDGMQERVYADPETGKFVTVREPIYRNEKVKSLIRLELLFHGDTLVAFKEKVLKGAFEVGH